MPNQSEIRERISKEIVEALKTGVSPWVRPWSSHANAGLPANAVSSRKYSGVILLLQLHQQRLNLQSKYYATFKQWHDLGCSVKARPPHVRSGRWGCNIIYYRPLKKVEQTESGEERETEHLLLCNYTVFCADQVEGIAADRLKATDLGTTTSFIDYAPAEKALAATVQLPESLAGFGAEIRGGIVSS